MPYDLIEKSKDDGSNIGTCNLEGSNAYSNIEEYYIPNIKVGHQI